MEELLAFRELQPEYLVWEVVSMAAQFTIINLGSKKTIKFQTNQKKVINRSLTSYLHQNPAKSNETIFGFNVQKMGP